MVWYITYVLIVSMKPLVSRTKETSVVTTLTALHPMVHHHAV